MASNDEPNNQLHDSFVKESEKLEKLITSITEKPEKLAIDEIISTYYLVLDVKSLMEIIKQHVSNNNLENLAQRVLSTEKLIQNIFNNILHPLILSQLNESIQEYVNNLKANKSKEKSKEILQKEAKLYEKLRELMSTKEFVQQYDKGLIK